MKSFKDCEGREWHVSVNVDSIKRVKSLINIDLLDVADGKLFSVVLANPITLVNTVYCLCLPQAEQRNVSDADFGRAMAGDAIDHASTAVLEELIDFFPNRQRQILRKALTKVQEVEARGADLAVKHLDSPELATMIESTLKELGDSFGNLLPSSAAIPAA